MAPKKRPGKKISRFPEDADLSGPFYEGFAERSEPGQGKAGFPVPPRYWKRYKFERKSLRITGELPSGN